MTDEHAIQAFEGVGVGLSIVKSPASNEFNPLMLCQPVVSTPFSPYLPIAMISPETVVPAPTDTVKPTTFSVIFKS